MNEILNETSETSVSLYTVESDISLKYSLIHFQRSCDKFARIRVSGKRDGDEELIISGRRRKQAEEPPLGTPQRQGRSNRS